MENNKSAKLQWFKNPKMLKLYLMSSEYKIKNCDYLMDNYNNKELSNYDFYSKLKQCEYVDEFSNGRYYGSYLMDCDGVLNQARTATLKTKDVFVDYDQIFAKAELDGQRITKLTKDTVSKYCSFARLVFTIAFKNSEAVESIDQDKIYTISEIDKLIQDDKIIILFSDKQQLDYDMDKAILLNMNGEINLLPPENTVMSIDYDVCHNTEIPVELKKWCARHNPYINYLRQYMMKDISENCFEPYKHDILEDVKQVKKDVFAELKTDKEREEFTRIFDEFYSSIKGAEDYKQ